MSCTNQQNVSSEWHTTATVLFYQKPNCFLCVQLEHSWILLTLGMKDLLFAAVRRGLWSELLKESGSKYETVSVSRVLVKKKHKSSIYLSIRDQGYWKTVNRYFVSSCQNPLALQSDREASSVDISEHAPRRNCIQTQRKNEWVTTKQNVVIVALASAEGSTFGRKKW